MASDHDEIERTEAASPRWVAQARERGIWPRSAELTVACSILAGVLTLRYFTGPITDSLLDTLSTGLKASDVSRPSAGFGNGVIAELCRPLLLVAIVLSVPAIAAAVASVGQVGFRFKPEILAPDFARLSAPQNLEKIFSGRALAESLIATVKWTGLLALSAWWLWNDLLFVQRGGSDPESFIRLASGTMLRVGTKVAATLFVLGCIDYARAWWTHWRQMRQSRAELIAELRESEGDPVVRRRRRQRQMDLALGKRDKPAQTGNLVVLGNGRLAVALRVSDHSATTLVAKAVGTAADRLQRAARTSGTRVVRQDTLARSLFRAVRPGQRLPTELDAALQEHRPHRQFTQNIKL